MTIPVLENAIHQGVPVTFADIRSTYRGSLVFAVGIRDEVARTCGLTHLVEHLVVSQLGKVSVVHNAVTSEDCVEFFAEGPEDQVADFLNRVSRSIRDIAQITEAVVEEQRRIISAEIGAGDEVTGTGPLLDRFGARTLGLLDVGSPSHRSLGRDAAQAWVRTWFHTGNAALVFSGPVPGSLNVELPAPPPDWVGVPRVSGERVVVARQTPEPLPYRRSGWVAGGEAPLAVSLFLTTHDRVASFVAAGALYKALHDELRTVKQLIYSVEMFTSRINEHTTFLALSLDPQRESTLNAAREALAVVRRLATDGPSGQLLADVAEEDSNAIHHSDTQLSYLRSTAVNALRFGIEPLPLETPDTTAEAVRAAIADGLETLLVSLGEIEGVETSDEVDDILGLEWARIPEGHYEAMTSVQRLKAFMRDGADSYSPKMFKGLKGYELVLDPERALWLAADQGITEIRWSDVVLAGVCTDCGHWDVTDADGKGFVVEPDLWRGGDKIVARMREKIPPVAVYSVRHPSQLRD